MDLTLPLSISCSPCLLSEVDFRNEFWLYRRNHFEKNWSMCGQVTALFSWRNEIFIQHCRCGVSCDFNVASRDRVSNIFAVCLLAFIQACTFHSLPAEEFTLPHIKESDEEQISYLKFFCYGNIGMQLVMCFGYLMFDQNYSSNSLSSCPHHQSRT